jgi:hypothetical protein
MLDVTLLAAQIESLESTADKLSTANVILLYVAGVVAVFLAVHAFWSSRVNTRLRKAQNDVIRAKDEQATREKQASDEKIASLIAEAENAKTERAQANLAIEEAKVRASQADERAWAAGERAAAVELRAQELESQNLELRSGVANLEKEAADARSAQQRIQTEMARQQQRAADAELRLEEERIERLRLEEAIAPRNIVSTQVMVDALKKFAGKKALIEHLYEDEPTRLAREISSVLDLAGWQVLLQPTQHVRGGENITVWAPTFNRPSEERNSSMAAANLLIKHLQADKLEVFGAPTGVLPSDTLQVSIGPRRSAYLSLKRDLEVRREYIFGEPQDPILEPLREETPFGHFSEEQQRLFVSKVGRVEGAPPVQLRCPANDDEACGLAMEVGVLLRRAGWEIQHGSVTRYKRFPSMTRDLEGRYPEKDTRVVVVARWREARSLPSWHIARAFETAGFPVQRTTDLFDPSAPILVIVYPKRP